MADARGVVEAAEDGPRPKPDRRVSWSVAMLVAAPLVSLVFLLGLGYPPGSAPARAVFAVGLPLVVAAVAGWLVSRRERPDRRGAVVVARVLMAVNVVASVVIVAYAAQAGMFAA